MTRAAVIVTALMACPVLVFAEESSKYDIPVPSQSPPWMVMNQQGEVVRCDSSPWQKVDLGTVGGAHIYMGDHCAMQTDDPMMMTFRYASVLTSSCDLQNVCYAVPGNTKAYCDDMAAWQWNRNCDHQYSFQMMERMYCQGAAGSWRSALNTGVSTQYWNGSQAWGRQHCAALATWVPMPATGVPPVGAIYSGPGAADAVCRVTYQGGVHAGRITGANCDIGYGGKELAVSGAEVLVIRSARPSWIAAGAQGQVPAQAILAGFGDGQWRAVCRAIAGGPMRAGKVVGGYCNIGFGGKEIPVRPFQVLTVG
jgi:hypothetical protein